MFLIPTVALAIATFSHPSVVQRATRQSLVYISDAYNNFVAIFDRNGTSAGTITSGLNDPQGLFVDSRHNLWVADAGNGNVLKFPRGASAPTETLHDAGRQPYDVTICPDGTVFVANVGLFFSGGNIEVYSHGKRSRSLSFGDAAVFYVTCDPSGNLFAAILYGTTSVVAEFPNAQQSGAKLLNIGDAGNPGGIKAEADGDLLYNDEAGQVTEYTSAGSPTGRSINVPGGWTDIAIDRAENAVLGADYGNQLGAAYAFPGGTLLQSYDGRNFSFPTGVAFDPAVRT